MNLQGTTPGPLIVATDLDGTLLDHYTYDWQPAARAIELLKQKCIPLVINTSKTADEVVLLQRELDIEDPFIVENGSAVYIHCRDERFDLPGDVYDDGSHRIKILGGQRESIVATLTSLKRDRGWRFDMFSDFDSDELAALTGLSSGNALLALQRHYSEPLIWRDSQDRYSDFCDAVRQRGLSLLRGGRFVHVLGQTGKGAALRWLADHYRAAGTTLLIALGDSANDIDMLRVADYPVLVKSPSHDFPAIDGNVIRTEETGPAGWNLAVIDLVGTICERLSNGSRTGH
jgi:mannosyl-3-phosphoglycerate phosphatase